MGDIVALNKTPIDIHSDLGRCFVIDATRAAEGLLTDQELQEKYELSLIDLKNIATDKTIGRAIRDERDRRVRLGHAARELAAKAFVKSPGILDQIQTHAESPRHRIDAIRELRATASGGDDGSPASQGEKFTIIINLGADAEDRIEHTFDVTPKPPKLEGEIDGNEW